MLDPFWRHKSSQFKEKVFKKKWILNSFVRAIVTNVTKLTLRMSQNKQAKLTIETVLSDLH